MIGLHPSLHPGRRFWPYYSDDRHSEALRTASDASHAICSRPTSQSTLILVTHTLDAWSQGTSLPAACSLLAAHYFAVPSLSSACCNLSPSHHSAPPPTQRHVPPPLRPRLPRRWHSCRAHLYVDNQSGEIEMGLMDRDSGLRRANTALVTAVVSRPRLSSPFLVSPRPAPPDHIVHLLTDSGPRRHPGLQDRPPGRHWCRGDCRLQVHP